MENFIIYVAESSLCLVILYMVYWLFLKKDTFFAANRFYLITSIILSLIIPALNFNIGNVKPESGYGYVLDTVTITSTSLKQSYFENLSIYSMLFILYFIGVSFFLMRFAFQMHQLSRLIKRFGITNKEGLNIIFTDASYAPFSFFNFIFMNRDMRNDDVEKILAHELIHVKQRHSFDIFITEMLVIFQWFNPIVWFYRHSLKEIHEYLADEGVLMKGHGKIYYQQLLLSMTTGIPVTEITNNFNKSLIKRRFIMMTKIKSKMPAKFKIMFAAPVIAGLILMFACTKNGNTSTALSENGKGNANKQISVAEEMPQFSGGTEAMYKYMAENIKYPQAAKEKGIQGKVWVSFNIDTDGSITDVKLVQDIGGGCGEEAVRVVKAMPKWIPGKSKGKPVKVQMNLPVLFTLTDK